MKICPLFKMAVIISNKGASQETEKCQGNKCQWWYLCSELDDSVYTPPQDEEDPGWAGARHYPELENESKTVSFEGKDVPE